jgi:hypothetical protein
LYTAAIDEVEDQRQRRKIDFPLQGSAEIIPDDESRQLVRLPGLTRMPNCMYRGPIFSPLQTPRLKGTPTIIHPFHDWTDLLSPVVLTLLLQPFLATNPDDQQPLHLASTALTKLKLFECVTTNLGTNTGNQRYPKLTTLLRPLVLLPLCLAL